MINSDRITPMTPIIPIIPIIGGIGVIRGIGVIEDAKGGCWRPPCA